MNSNGTDAAKEEAELPNEWERKPLPYLFEKELIENQNKHIYVHAGFVPSNKVYPLEAKFYARHDYLPANYQKYIKDTAEPATKIIANIAKPCPRLESQVYGLLQQHLTSHHLNQLNFINAPKQRCAMTAFGEALIAERITERPDFNGLRFFLQ